VLKRREMLGLERGTVRVFAYHTGWHNLFEQERRVLHEHCGAAHGVDDCSVASTILIGAMQARMEDIKESAPEVRTHHLHVVSVGDTQWRNYLLLRDTLRANEALRVKYAKLKRALQGRFAWNRKGYLDAKHNFIRSILWQPPKA
jgi:GrpB-like predicted nucleotidyltransferase (UPF0157 family)